MLRCAAAGGLVFVALIRVAGQCIREWLRLRTVRDLATSGIHQVKVVGGPHGCAIEIHPNDQTSASVQPVGPFTSR